MTHKLHLALPLLALALTSCDKTQQQAGGSEASTVIETFEMTPNGGSRIHSTTVTPAVVNPKFAAALAKVDALGPSNYPDIVTPLPEKADFESIPTDKLMTMLESWNPALRSQAANALPSRGNEAVPLLLKGIRSDSWSVRAGSTTALRAIIMDELNACNSIKDRVARDEAKEAAKEKYSEAINQFINLAADERAEVRGAALEAIITCAPRTDDFRRALMGLWDDPDEFISQSSKGNFNKHFGLGDIPPSEFIPAIKAGITSGELPTQRGVLIKLIERMKPELQREFIPELLGYLDWIPRRDTMFAGVCNQEAVRILTELKEPQLIERIPMVLHKNRAFAFDACVEAARAFGKDAIVVLPTLKTIYADCKDGIPKEGPRPHTHKWDASMQKLKETIEYLESL